MSNLLLNKDVEQMASDYITISMAYSKPATYEGFYLQVVDFFQEVHEAEGLSPTAEDWRRLLASIDVQTIMAWKEARRKFKAFTANL